MISPHHVYIGSRLPATPLALAIQEQGVAVLHHTVPCPYLYTVGNTAYRCPELLLFCQPHVVCYYADLLQELSRFMWDTDAIPQANRAMTFQGRRLYPIVMDNIYIAQFADDALKHYNHTPRLTMLQLLLPDLAAQYPHDPDYDTKFLEQPLLKCH